eukprot:30881-Pelagococcus_subviridis.AAC.3
MTPSGERERAAARVEVAAAGTSFAPRKLEAVTAAARRENASESASVQLCVQSERATLPRPHSRQPSAGSPPRNEHHVGHVQRHAGDAPVQVRARASSAPARRRLRPSRAGRGEIGFFFPPSDPLTS